MGSKKILSGDHIMEVLFNEDSDHNLIPETDFNESSDNEKPESPEIILITDVADEAIPETSPGYCPPFPPFAANAGLNTDIQSTDFMTFVSLFITNKFLECVYEKTNVYSSQVIGAAPRPFTKHSQFQTWTPVTTLPQLKTCWGLIFVTGIINKPTLKLYWSEDLIF
jgi:hypothetical protein